MQIVIQTDSSEPLHVTEFNPSLLDPESAERRLLEHQSEPLRCKPPEPETQDQTDEMGPALGMLIAAGIGVAWWTALFAVFQAFG